MPVRHRAGAEEEPSGRGEKRAWEGRKFKMIYAGKVVDFNFTLTYNLIIECDICRAFVPRVLSERDMSKTKTSKEKGVLGLLAGCVGEYKLASVLTSVWGAWASINSRPC